MTLQNYDMVLGIQWLKLLGNVLANYEDKWMTFLWQGKEVTLKGDNPKLTQSIRLEELNGLLTNNPLLAEVNICSLRVLEDDGQSLSSQEGSLPVKIEEDFPLQALLETYHHIFSEPVGLPPVR
jgi:hypothetical protein